ncbi:DUF6758 family protein [Actinoallomurus sp. NBC_01490]|uniref:DUF6758 family protein n=1 Tax=Actinoallomurus sp. NBC_01490 TaxID=2903557 RepID=UPI002E38073B|nr:DUF6758 family protein [Actinoallomurus sp. NBC_01490]
MRTPPTCPRCRRSLVPPSAWSSAWTCLVHGEVPPLRPPMRPCPEALEAVRSRTRVPVWVPWPPPTGWLVTGFAEAGDDRSGAVAVAVALSGPSPIGGPADLVLVAEEPGVGLGASYAGLNGPDPGHGFGVSAPNAKVEIDGRPVSMWALGTEKTAAYAGEALANWLWAVLWPESAGVLMVEQLNLRDLREAPLDLPYGAACPRLA